MGYIKSIVAIRGVGQVSKLARIGKGVMQVTLQYRCRAISAERISLARRYVLPAVDGESWPRTFQ